MSKQTERVRAVIVGIDRYDSNKAPRLRGAVNDAKAWLRLCVDDWGIPVEEVTVLASPAFEPGALGKGYEGVRVLAATRANILGELANLRDTLVRSWYAARQEGKNTFEAETGLFTYSGHGVATKGWRSSAGESLALCPSDLTFSDDGKAVGNAIRYADLSEALGRPANPKAPQTDSHDALVENLTIVLDTCQNNARRTFGTRHAIEPSETFNQAGAFLELKPGTRERAADPIGRRVLLAATLDQVAEEIRTDAGWRGAFSHALTSLLRRWRTSTLDRGPAKGASTPRYFQVSHNHLVDRAGDLLASLGAKQTPALVAYPAVGDMAFLKAGVEGNPGETTREPNRVGGGRQFPVEGLDWAWVELGATVRDGRTTTTKYLGYLLVTGAELPTQTIATTMGSFSSTPNEEHWFKATENIVASGDEIVSIEWHVHYVGDRQEELKNWIEVAPGLKAQSATIPVSFVGPANSVSWAEEDLPTGFAYFKDESEWYLGVPTDQSLSELVWAYPDDPEDGLLGAELRADNATFESVTTPSGEFFVFEYS
jgi:Caspase domain